jgi:homoserine dehydrogenase
MKKKPLRAVIVGFGNVGQKLAVMLGEERGKYPGLAGLDLEAVAVFTGRHGALVEPAGLRLADVLGRFRKDNAFPAAPMTVLQALETLDYDVLVELSTLHIAERGEPAVAHVRAALERGRHVVSANKGPAAFAYRELAELARKNKALFLFESAVMDGAPVFGLAGVLRGCRVTGFSGILNTTTNFVISRLEVGESLDDAVSAAQRLGFAEADPTLDLDGWDAAAKTAILANFFLGADTDPLRVERQGIMNMGAADVARAAAAGRRLKLVCRAWRENGVVRAEVKPREIPVENMFAMINGRAAALRLETDMMAPVWVVQEDPGLTDTAAGVIQDLMTVPRRKR